MGCPLLCFLFFLSIFYNGITVFAFYMQVLLWLRFTPMRAQPFRFTSLLPFGHNHGRHVFFLVLVLGLREECCKVICHIRNNTDGIFDCIWCMCKCRYNHCILKVSYLVTNYITIYAYCWYDGIFFNTNTL